MKPTIELPRAQVFEGDCREVLKSLPDNSVDSIVTDPPYGLSNTSSDLVSRAIVRWVSGDRNFIPDGKGFMGKDWDAFVPPPAVWDECLRVLKPGGHLLAFFGSRTVDLGQLSIRLAGFEVRDSIAWLYGSGFPKSLDVSKAIDKAAGAERERVRISNSTAGSEIYAQDKWTKENAGTRLVDEPITSEAQHWAGWGTALKPAHEPIVVARKPLSGTVAETVLEWGTGGLNIDGSRIGTTVETWPSSRNYSSAEMSRPGSTNADDAETQKTGPAPAGRWPANVILDEYTADLLDQQSGVSKDGVAVKENSAGRNIFSEIAKPTAPNHGYGGQGGASRFFYCAKASKRDRNEGLDGLKATRHSDRKKDDGKGGDNPRNRTNTAKQNFHPTVKPTDLMRYLVKLVTPPRGTVLDPFAGSGSTGKAAILESFNFIGVEVTAEYLPIIRGRLEWAVNNQDTALF